MNKITYHKEGDYWIPDIIVENCRKDYHIGKYGHLRLKYIKEHKRGLYTELLITGKLPEHIVDVDINANKKVQSIIKELAEEENIDEIYANVLKNVPNANKKYVEKQLNELERNLMAYLSYWNEKYYRNGFVDGSQIAMGCFEE